MRFGRLLIALCCVTQILHCQAQPIKNETKTNIEVALQNSRQTEIAFTANSTPTSGKGSTLNVEAIVNTDKTGTQAPEMSTEKADNKKSKEKPSMISVVSMIAQNGKILPENLGQDTVNLTPIDEKALLNQLNQANQSSNRVINHLDCKSEDNVSCKPELTRRETTEDNKNATDSKLPEEKGGKTQAIGIRPICLKSGLTCPKLFEDEPLSGVYHSPGFGFPNSAIPFRLPDRVPPFHNFGRGGLQKPFVTGDAPYRLRQFHAQIEHRPSDFRKLSRNGVFPRPDKRISSDLKRFERPTFGNNPHLIERRGDSLLKRIGETNSLSPIKQKEEIIGHNAANFIHKKEINGRDNWLRHQEHDLFRLSNQPNDKASDVIYRMDNTRRKPFIDRNSLPNFNQNHKVWRKVDLEKSLKT